MSTGSCWSRLAVAGLLLWSNLSVSLVLPVRSMAQGTSATSPVVREAQELYEQSRFDDAITKLADLVERGQLTGGDLEKAREILARSYVKRGSPQQARDMFKAMLRQNSAYRVDPVRIPPDEVAVFEQAMKELSEEPRPAPPVTAPAPSAAPPPSPPPSKAKKPLWAQWWVWAIGAGVVAGAAAAAGGGGGDGGSTPDPTLASFPKPPGR